MNILNEIAQISTLTENINKDYIVLLIYSLFSLLIIKFINKLISVIYLKFNHNDKKKYIVNKRIDLFSNILIIFILFLIWEPYIKNIITLISVISAAITLAIKDIIFNFFSGLYIKITKPFKLEDRIKIGNNLGDVVNINYLSFEILEVKNENEGEQSTGIIIQIPSSTIFTESLKNYNKAFKYIWRELDVNLPLNADVNKTKKILYNIIKKNNTLNDIPDKMQNQLDDAVSKYRIYYNNLDPIIYTKIVDNHIVLTLRYLIHPKKIRNVESEIWSQILIEATKKNIELYKPI